MKKFNMNSFPIAFFQTKSIHESDVSAPDMWKDLGITLAMAPYSDEGDDEKILALLDRSHELGIQVILYDCRTLFHSLRASSEEKYRKDVADVVRAFGNHPALFGLYIGDEPSAETLECAILAHNICQELLPDKVIYFNLLPWLEGIGEYMGAENLESYIDRWVKEASPKALSYDCYAHMNEIAPSYDAYFHNLRHYKEAYQKYQIPFFNIVLSVGHWDYRSPTKDDFMWQLTTSVACGASAVSWFYIEMPYIHDNFRDAPINLFNERTERFTWLSEVNRLFNAHCGEIIAGLNIDSVYMAKEAYGGFPLFEPFGCVKVFESDYPAIISRFYDDEGREYYAICSNSPTTTIHVKYEFECSKFERCVFGNKFAVVNGEKSRGKMEMYPGQLMLFRVTP